MPGSRLIGKAYSVGETLARRKSDPICIHPKWVSSVANGFEGGSLYTVCPCHFGVHDAGFGGGLLNHGSKYPLYIYIILLALRGAWGFSIRLSSVCVQRVAGSSNGPNVRVHRKLRSSLECGFQRVSRL